LQKRIHSQEEKMATLLEILLNAFFELLPAIAEYMGFKRRLRDVGDTVPITESSHERKEGINKP
jgi:hypothetical protein